MLLSSSDVQFTQVTLIIRADHQRAELWAAKELEVTHIASVARPELPHHEHSTDTGEVHADEAAREYLVLLEKAIVKQATEHQAAHLWLVMDAELLHRVRETLPSALQAKITHCLSRDLMQEEMQVVVTRTWTEGEKTV